MKNAILIAGPTASGKSALALRLAQETGGTVVNADSMQVYGVLLVLTARPGEVQLAAAPHRLYGHVDPREAYSTGRWMRDVDAMIRSGELGDKPAIFVGGTGLYFRALLEGLSAMPEVPAILRQRWRNALAEHGPNALHELLVERDPVAARAIRASDGQRIVRALEVLEASGKPISQWQARSGTPLVEQSSAQLMVIEPDRTILKARIDERFDAMIEEGALEEVRAIAALGLDDVLPVMKAIGVRELLAADRGETGFDEAIYRAKIATRQYAKRQSTWFRNQLGPDWQRISMSE